MARCHHDDLEFDSDPKIEVAREGDILEAGQELKDIKCAKNPGHRGFIPFKDLTSGDIPDGSVDKFNRIKTLGNCVVRLVVDKINKEGEKKGTAYGTGFVEKCNNVYLIRTNNHVVRTKEECRNCTIEFHYESYDESNIITSRGVKLGVTCPYRDYSWFTFDPVPGFLKQLDLKDVTLTMPTIVIKYKNGKFVRNGSSIEYKQHLIHFTGIDLNDPQIDTMFLEFNDDSISDIKSSYFKFQPIPSIIPDIINIGIHVDEDDSYSTVISGDVVKFGDEYVVKISESIFQDKVKKCRLVWNGEVISRGTRLYFQQFQSREFFSGRIGLEFRIKQFPTNVWLFDYQPKSRELKRRLEILHAFPTEGTLCCIGHPHCGIKMVTFGTKLGVSLERFDIHGRRIKEAGEGCQFKEVRCFRHSCKTCPGSSGSPVFLLDDLSYQWFYRIHFMGDKVDPYDHKGTLVENINTSR